MKPPTDEEVRQLIRGYDEATLRENHAIAARQPGTEWCRLLTAEIVRRGMSVAATVPDAGEGQ